MALSQTKDDKKTFNEIEEIYDRDHQELAPRFVRFNVWEELYFSHLRNKDNPWKSSVFDPESFEKVERMVSHLFATKPKGRFLPSEGDDIGGTAIADEVFKYQWRRPGQNMQQKLTRGGRSMGIFGGAWFLLQWRYERRQQSVTGKDKKETKQWIVKWDDPFVKDLYIYDCFPDSSATDPEDMHHFMHNEFTTLDELKAMNSKFKGSFRYKNLDILEEKLSRKKDTSATQDFYRTQADIARGSTSNSEKKGRILVRRYYDRDRWITIVPDYKLVIEDRSNPYDHGDLPIHYLVDQQYTNQLQGIGEIEPIEKLQKGLNSVLNQRLDNVRLILDPVIVHDDDSANASLWKFAPGYKWGKGKNETMPQTFQIQDVTGATFLQTTNYFKASLTKTVGQQDFLSAASQSIGNRTATEARAATGEQNARTRSKELNVDAFIERLGTQWMQLNQQFLTKTRLISIVGADSIQEFLKKAPMHEETVTEDQGGQIAEQKPLTVPYKGKEINKFRQSGDFGILAVSPEDIQQGMHFYVEAGSTVDNDVAQESANLDQTIDTLMKLQPVLQSQGKQINYVPLIERKLALNNIKDSSDIITDAPTPQAPTAPTSQGAPTSGGIPPELAAMLGQSGGAPATPAGMPGIPGIMPAA